MRNAMDASLVSAYREYSERTWAAGWMSMDGVESEAVEFMEWLGGSEGDLEPWPPDYEDADLPTLRFALASVAREEGEEGLRRAAGRLGLPLAYVKERLREARPQTRGCPGCGVPVIRRSVRDPVRCVPCEAAYGLAERDRLGKNWYFHLQAGKGPHERCYGALCGHRIAWRRASR